MMRVMRVEYTGCESKIITCAFSFKASSAHTLPCIFLGFRRLGNPQSFSLITLWLRGGLGRKV